MTGHAGTEGRLQAEQASLRRVATLVAGGAPSADVFAAIAREVAQVIGLPLVAVWRYEPEGRATVVGVWSKRPSSFEVGTRWSLDGPTICARVRETGRPARIDDFTTVPGTIAEAARLSGICSCAGAPIVVDGEVWGAMSVDSTDPAPLPDDIEGRLLEFTELLGSAISSSASREELSRLADEQAALRRVATLVARGVSQEKVFQAGVGEMGRLFDVDMTHIGRYEPDGAATGVAGWSRSGRDHLPPGVRSAPDDDNVTGMVRRTRQAARIDDYASTSGVVAAMLREAGIRSSVGVPIVAGGRLWGVVVISSRAEQPPAADCASRMEAFTKLFATAISNSAARDEVGRLAEEQAALRRVATLIAQGVPPSKLFGAVTGEAGRLLGADLAGMIRYVTDDSTTAVATWSAAGEQPQVHGVWPLDGDWLSTTIFTTGRPARQDDWSGVSGPIAVFLREQLGIRCSVGSPIIVEGRVWGGLFVHVKTAHALPPDTDERLTSFTELMSTAMSNAQARAEVRRLADEQAALRRVATLVARERSPAEVFAAVAEEVGRLLAVENVHVCRYEEEAAVVVGKWGSYDAAPVGTRLPLQPEDLLGRVRRTGEPARVDDEAATRVATPIVVERGLWGAMVASSHTLDSLPTDTESRVGKFTELVATAISNVQARSDLAASRARLVAAADAERRGVVRDLHDGAQQRLIQTVLTLKLALTALAEDDGSGPALVMEALDHAERATIEVRELAHGLLPAVLTQGGLRSAVDALASRMPIPVDNDVEVERLPAAVEATAYFVIAESLTNVVKHAKASGATVRARIEDGGLRIQVRDDGIGGAQPGGSGLVGLADRLAVHDGRLRIESPALGGTLIHAEIPLRPGLDH